MQIDSLKYFYEVAELKSISKVANNSHISQPALSHQLSKLEKELGAKLFERSNRGVELTPQGEILYNYAKEIILSHNNLVEEINANSLSKSEIGITNSSIYANFLVATMAKDIGKIFKNCNININNHIEGNEQSLLLHNKCDVIVGCNIIHDVDLSSNYIGRDKLILVGTEETKDCKIDSLSIAFLNDKLTPCSKEIEKLDQSKISLKTNSLSTIREYLMNANTAAIVPMISVRRDLERGILTDLGCKEYEKSYDIFITHKKNIENPLKKKINLFKKELERILNKEGFKLVI
ncbi:MAG: LysR family transcriptional regulator [Clostridium sp.]|uniref:LysR family transcriptional regulator n=1 Tax=Clostridium sp. TaxID=1506 RepID=UPI003F3656D1